ncbi:MAG TPA: hypothetical protein VGV16_01075 [Gammaproteobacteria bacterium]|nr:hypothetical protein [Gammaproteobacteria bacterium]
MILMHRFPPSRGPVSRLFSALVLLVIFTLAFFLGTFLFLVILGFVVILGVALYLRIWWLRRRSSGREQAGPVTLEGEYTVEKPRDRERH